MNEFEKDIPIKTAHLFPKLDKLLINLLKSLSDEEWNYPTIAKNWQVKDIVSHLLDGNVKTLSISRDKYFSEIRSNINSYNDLVTYINEQNMNWTLATKKMSPQLLIELLESTGKQFCNHISTLDPFEKAVFSVAWAGENTSKNWFHIAREYSEKFLHQQQIREAVGKQALFTKELYYPFINTFMHALPFTYRNVDADPGTIVTVKINTTIGGKWNIIKTKKGWNFLNSTKKKSNSIIIINPQIAWKLFSKGISTEQAIDKVEIIGNISLGKKTLEMISVMA
jgi:hypothetical protein